MVTKSLFSDLYEPNLRKIIFESYAYNPTEYDKILNVQSVDVPYIEDYKMGGFGNVPTKPEGTAIIYDDPVPGSRVRFDWTPYGKGFRVTYEAQEDDKYGPMKKMAQALGKAFRACPVKFLRSFLRSGLPASMPVSAPRHHPVRAPPGGPGSSQCGAYHSLRSTVDGVR